MKEWIVGLVLLTLLGFGMVGYARYDAVEKERTKKELEAAEQYRELNEKYNTVSEQYTELKAKREVKRQAQVVKEDRIINENREYYAGDCFDAGGLQHIQEAQSASATK